MTHLLSILPGILLAAVITFALRALPFVLLDHGRSMPRWAERLGGILPPAIIAALVIYCLRGSITGLTGRGWMAFASLLPVVLLYRWKKNTLLSIAVGTAVYMILIRVL